MSEWLVHLPTWMIARTTGLIAYHLLFAGMFLGILYGTPSLKGPWKARTYTWHARTQSAGMIFALVHILILVIDHYRPFSWPELLIPFSHPDHRITYGMGSLAFYGLLLVLLTSDFRTLLPKKLWLTLHMLSYPVYFLALLHGIYNGTDTQTPAVFGGYIATAAALILITFYRAAAESRARDSRPSAHAKELSREVRHP
jgi:DMSO/TMAO reductase YedYZ heme-binding membrane subunit